VLKVEMIVINPKHFIHHDNERERERERERGRHERFSGLNHDIFSRTITSKIYGMQSAAAVHKS
jgi:hypothetical protein